MLLNLFVLFRVFGGPFRRKLRCAAAALLLACLALTGSVQGAAAPLAWRQEPGCRVAALLLSAQDGAGLALQPPRQTGVWFTNLLPEARHLTNQILPSGSGVAAGDFDGDSWCDLYFCGLKDSGNRLYRNLGGWQFADLTAQAGVACLGLDCTGAAFADLDADGDLDLVVNSIGGGTRLFFNDGKGRFTAAPVLLNQGLAGMSLGLADADGDGDLDLYLANYRVATLTDAPGTRFSFKIINGKPTVSMINGRPLTDPEWTNRFRFNVEMGPGGRGRFAREELGEPDAYFLNDGHGRFTPAPFTSGLFLDEEGRPLTAPLFDWGLAVLFRDLNGDGAPDLYVCNDFGTPDRFWLNDGHGRFRLAPLLALRQTSLSSMAADAADLDRDGYDDLVVLDMLSREHRRRLTQRNIMRPDLVASTEITGRPQYPRNTLLWNRGDGTYAEIAHYAGIEGSEWSWNPVLFDVDLDGYEDLLVPNGFVRDNNHADALNRIEAKKAGRRLSPLEELRLRALYPPLNTPNLAFRNLGNLRFAECSQAWGFDQPVISQGACLADLDNDGDLDLAVNNLNSVAGLYRNNASAARVAVRLQGQPPNTAGIGARITVSGGPVAQSQEIVCGGRYCSSDQAQRTFAAGIARLLEVRVRWRSGRETVVSNIPPNQVIEVIEPPTPSSGPGQSVANRAATPAASPAVSGPIETPAPGALIRFADVSDAIRHAHQDALYDDFERQPLLPRKFSNLGPGVAWWDIDGDGRDDLVIGGGRGGTIALYRNLGEGHFERRTDPAWDLPLERDAAGFAGVAPGALLVAFANYEDGLTNRPGVMAYGTAGPKPLLPLVEASFGPLAVADYDGDGGLDLFVGARVVGGRYPAPASSRLYRRKSGELELDTANTKTLPDALVSSAIWTDLTGDGRPELVLACDWGPLRIFRNEQGKLAPWDVPITWPANAPTRDETLMHMHRSFDARNARSDGVPARAGLASLGKLTGWWNGVAAGDFDNDGRLDLIAANWGANTRYERWRPPALRLDLGDLNQDGSVDILESHYVAELQGYAPERMLDAVARSLPQLTERFPTHQAWAEASIDAVLGDWRGQAQRLEALWLESTLLLNRGDHFECRVLPAEAQFAPAFAVCVGDADGDGNEDAFLSQNFFGVEMDTSRYDAGRGLWLRGDGHGRMSPVRGQDCGVRVYGEQRGAALSDFDGDGRVDLVVTQNSAETKLYRNIGAKSGLRVRLEGVAGNPCGVGAVVRLRHGETAGPAREIRAGSGYWSQDSPVLVLGTAVPPAAIQVRWPGGRLTESLLPPGVKEVRVRANGEIEVIAP
ncbi:MAG: VCBS repeat-containing protein [Verrucomicrobiota bacterium]